MARAVALLSGGLDSGVALGLWRESGGEVAACLTFDYGQRSAEREAAAAQALAGRWGLPWFSVNLPWLGELAGHAGSALVGRDRELPRGTAERPGDEASAAAVWVPARNAVLISAAGAWAEAHGAEAVVVGFNREEAATFSDNSPAFLMGANELLRLGTRTGVRVESPTLDRDKRQIVAEARRLGLRSDDFWSCYDAGPDPCGRCESCLRSVRAWSA